MHIPLQSGDDEVLKRMKRGYKREQYLQLIRKIESKVSDFCLSMDCMVGFPGESEAAFERTLEIVERTHALKVHIFPYSPREGTFAYQFTDKVSPQIQKRRMMTFARAAERIAQEKKSFFLGKTVKVLVEESLGCALDDYRGHTTHYLPVQFKSPRDQVNQEVRVRLSKLQGDYLVGDLLSDGCEGF